MAATFNLGPVRNALAMWLGIEPADLFLYIFLPPMLLDAAVRIDYFLLRKVRVVYEPVGACFKGLGKLMARSAERTWPSHTLICIRVW